LVWIRILVLANHKEIRMPGSLTCLLLLATYSAVAAFQNVDEVKIESGQDILVNFTNDGPVAQPDPLKARLDLVEAATKNQK
jgi:hypothetical protein